MNTQDHNKRELVDTSVPKPSEHNKETLEDGLRNEINDDDNRDHGDSTEDWDAENSRTGRHK